MLLIINHTTILAQARAQAEGSTSNDEDNDNNSDGLDDLADSDLDEGSVNSLMVLAHVELARTIHMSITFGL